MATFKENIEKVKIYLNQQIDDNNSLKEVKKLERKNKKILNIISELGYKNIWIHKIINFLFIALLFISFGFLIGFPSYYIFHSIKESNFSPFKLIEDIFIAPMPLIIVFAFYQYYIKNLKPIITFTGSNNEHDFRSDSMLDLSITKFLFASVLFSTIAVSMLETFIEITKPIEVVWNTKAESYTSNELITKNIFVDSCLSAAIDSLKNSNNLIDTVNSQSKKVLETDSLIKEILKVKKKYDNPSILMTQNNMHFFGIILGFLLLILLMIYIFRLEKHISHKLENKKNSI